MRKYINLLKYEFKTILKDATNLFLILYPFILLILIGLIIPLAFKKAGNIPAFGIILVLVISLSVGGFVSGALLGFSLIENIDEKTILSIAVSPIRVEGYTFFKISYTYILAIISNLIIVGGLKLINNDVYIVQINNQTIHLLDNFSWLHIIVFSFVNGLLVPSVALLIASLAKNKVEGFAFMKSGGLFSLLPSLTLLNFFSDEKQYILGIFPNFWSTKAMINVAIHSKASSNLNYFIYMLIGSLYLIALLIITLKLFLKKVNQN